MFLDRQKQSKNPKYILVHCTHGHNRTGFMIIHYLMRTHVSCVAEVGQLDRAFYFILFSFHDHTFSRQ
jgi:protein-tyrosine phosphatase